MTDAGLQHLAGLRGLKYLTSPTTQVTNAGLKPLGKISSLETLTSH